MGSLFSAHRSKHPPHRSAWGFLPRSRSFGAMDEAHEPSPNEPDGTPSPGNAPKPLPRLQGRFLSHGGFHLRRQLEPGQHVTGRFTGIVTMIEEEPSAKGGPARK